MAQELTANFGANSTKFSKGVQEIKAQLTELNKALELNKQAVADTNKKAKEYEKELNQLKTAEKENGTVTKEQKARMAELEKEIDKARIRAAQLKAEQIDLKTELKETTSELKKQKAGVSGVSDEMKKMKTLITGFIAAYGSKKLFELLIGSNDEMEQYTTSLEVMLGSASKASAMIEKMRDFAAKTPLTLEDVISGGSLLMSYGVDESNLIDTMTKLGDLARGNAEKMDRITLAYGQMLAKGKVTGEELMQMTEAGVPLQTTLAESIGVTGEEFSKMVSAGKVGIDDLNKAITGLTTGNGKFAGMMEKQSQTMRGMLSTLLDNLSEFMRKMGEGAFGEVKSALQEASDLLAEWEKDGTLDRWAQGVGVMLKNLIAFLKQAISVGLDFKEAIIAGAVALGTFKVAIGIGNIISTTVLRIKEFGIATELATIKQKAFNATGAANPYVLMASLLATLVVDTIAFTSASDDAKKSIDELKDSANGAKDKADELSDVLERYKTISNSTGTAAEKTEELQSLQKQLNDTYSTTAEKLDLVNGKYEDNIEKLQEATRQEKELALAKAQSYYDELASSDAKRNYDDVHSADSDEDMSAVSKITIATHKDHEGTGRGAYKTYPLFGDANLYDQVTGTARQRADYYKDVVTRLKEANLEATEAYKNYNDLWIKYEDEAQKIEKAKVSVDELTDSIEKSSKKTEENTETKNNNIKTTEELADSTSTLVKNLNELASAYAEQGKNGNISYDTMLKLIDAGYTQCISLDNETGKIKLNTEAYKELAKAKLASQIAEYDAKIAESDDYQKKYDEAFKANDAAGMAKYSKLLISAEIEGDTDKLKRDALQAMYDNFDTYMEAGSFSGSGSSSSSSSSDNEFKKASEAYKTEADKKIALIKRELEAKKELRDETIKAIDDEIEARKRMNEDNDLEKQINEVKAQLKYGQLDEFSREQMEKKLQGLYDDKAEKEWQRNAQERKNAANAKYESEQKSYNNQISAINESLKTVQQIMSAMADGSKSVESIVNNNNTRNNTANVNLIGTALTMAQITKAVKDALMDDIVIR
jgi:tape measure domain-containing protein|nr:MAG TPA: tail tape measure protein [Caudoviricetes sp.]